MTTKSKLKNLLLFLIMNDREHGDVRAKELNYFMLVFLGCLSGSYMIFVTYTFFVIFSMFGFVGAISFYLLMTYVILLWVHYATRKRNDCLT
jgi:hypothetical protein